MQSIRKLAMHVKNVIKHWIQNAISKSILVLSIREPAMRVMDVVKHSVQNALPKNI